MIDGRAPWNKPKPVVADAADSGTRPIKVAVCMPCRDQVETGFAHDLCRMVGTTVANSPIEVQTLFDRGTLLISQRENLVKAALRFGADYILWLDTDMRFPADTLFRLLAHQKPIVACNYATRVVPTTTTAFADIRKVKPTDRVYTFPDSTGLEAVHAVGMGVMLVNTDVYRDLQAPFFQLVWDAASGDYHGEDIYFCRLARAKGYEILLDHDLSKQVGHVGVWQFKHEHAVAHLQMALESAAHNSMVPVEGA